MLKRKKRASCIPLLETHKLSFYFSFFVYVAVLDFPHEPSTYALDSGAHSAGAYATSATRRRLLCQNHFSVQVELENVDGFDLGYDGIWPITTAGAASRIAAARLRSDNPLVNPSGSRFTYSYPFAAVGDDKAFNKIGGHYQVICEGKPRCMNTGKYHQCQCTIAVHSPHVISIVHGSLGD